MTGQLNGRPRCWQCAQVVDGYTPTGTSPHPTDGDVSMCVYCGALGTFASTPYGLTIRRPTEAEGRLYDSDDELVEVARAVRRALQRQRWP